jgi:hypothetical protein
MPAQPLADHGHTCTCGSCFTQRSKALDLHTEHTPGCACRACVPSGLDAAIADYLDGTAKPALPKPPLRLLGRVRRAVNALCLQMAWGDTKHGAPGCQRAPQELVEKAQRHLLAFQAGELLDEEQRPHLAAAMANIAYAIEHLEGYR